MTHQEHAEAAFNFERVLHKGHAAPR